jgi:hypothetical protein
MSCSGKAGMMGRWVWTVAVTAVASPKTLLTNNDTTIDPRKEALLVKLYFSASLDKTTLLTQLRLQRELHQQQYLLYRDDIAADMNTYLNDPERERDALLWEATRRMGELFEETVVQWLDETIGMIAEKL